MSKKLGRYVEVVEHEHGFSYCFHPTLAQAKRNLKARRKMGESGTAAAYIAKVTLTPIETPKRSKSKAAPHVQARASCIVRDSGRPTDGRRVEYITKANEKPAP
jgi:hypothetical protein